MLVALAAIDESVGDVITGLEAAAAGNGSVWASGRTCIDGTPALLKLGAGTSEREWMTAINTARADIVPRVFGAGELFGVGWLVLERCAAAFDRELPDHVAAVLAAAARWQHAATVIEAATTAMDAAWLHEMLQAAATESCPGDIAGVIDAVGRSWQFAVAEARLGVGVALHAGRAWGAR